MNKTGPVLLIDDDEDDRDFFKECFTNLRLNNEFVMFSNAFDAIQYLRLPYVNPFMIVCDINMPALNGIQMRDIIFNDPVLKEKSIPFMFLTTAADYSTVKKAYAIPIQGIFVKPLTIPALERTVRLMVEYWNESVMF